MAYVRPTSVLAMVKVICCEALFLYERMVLCLIFFRSLVYEGTHQCTRIHSILNNNLDSNRTLLAMVKSFQAVVHSTDISKVCFR